MCSGTPFWNVARCPADQVKRSDVLATETLLTLARYSDDIAYPCILEPEPPPTSWSSRRACSYSCSIEGNSFIPACEAVPWFGHPNLSAFSSLLLGHAQELFLATDDHCLANGEEYSTPAFNGIALSRMSFTAMVINSNGDASPLCSRGQVPAHQVCRSPLKTQESPGVATVIC